MKKIIATVKDFIQNPKKYKKALVIPAGVLVYAVSQYAGADSQLALELTAVLQFLGVIAAKNDR